MLFDFLTVLKTVPEKVQIVIHQDNTNPKWTDILTAIGTVGTVILSLYLLLRERFKGLIIEGYLKNYRWGIKETAPLSLRVENEIVNECNKPFKIKEFGIVHCKVFSRWSYKKVRDVNFSIDRYSHKKRIIDVEDSELKDIMLEKRVYLAFKDTTGKLHISRKPMIKEVVK